MTILHTRNGELRYPMSATTCQQRQSYINQSLIDSRGLGRQVDREHMTIVLDWRPPVDSRTLDNRFRRTEFKVVTEERLPGFDLALGTDADKYYPGDARVSRSEPGSTRPWQSFPDGQAESSPAGEIDSPAVLAMTAELNLLTARAALRGKRAFSDSASRPELGKDGDLQPSKRPKM